MADNESTGEAAQDEQVNPSVIPMRQLMEAGVHFGHQTKRWNPRMRQYIYGSRDGIHIINLAQTQHLFRDAYHFISSVVSKGRCVLFVGTKPQAGDIIREEALRAGQYYVVHRWLGGMLTNWETIKNSIEKLRGFERMHEDGTLERLPKKESLKVHKAQDKLERNLGGIKNMTELPGALVVVDPRREHIAVSEARKLRIPVVAITDTNCDPQLIDYVIPGNDDAIRAIRLFAGRIADACLAGQRGARRDDLADMVRTVGRVDGDIPVVVKKKPGPGAPPAGEASTPPTQG